MGTESGYAMAKERTGLIIKREGKIYARVTYTGADGKRHDLTRRATNRQDARRIINEILTELEKKGEQAIQASKLTFGELAEKYSAFQHSH